MRFQVQIALYTSDTKLQNHILGSLWLLGNLGTIGARGSRGFGSFTIKCPSAQTQDRFPGVNSGKDLEDGFKKICSEFFGIQAAKGSAPTGLPPFSIIHPMYWRGLILVSSDKNPVAVLNNLGKTFREFREDSSDPFPSRTIQVRGREITLPPGKHSKEHKNLLKAGPVSGTKGLVAVPASSIFGLPHPFQLSTPKAKVTIGCATRERRKSPVLFRVHRFGTDYRVSVQEFKAVFLDGDFRFFDPDDKTRFEDVKGSANYAEADAFLNQLRKQGADEVTV